MKRTVTVVGSGRAAAAPDLAKLVVTAVALRESMRGVRRRDRRDLAGAGELVTASVEAGGDEVAVEQLTFAVADEALLEMAARAAWPWSRAPWPSRRSRPSRGSLPEPR